MDKAVEARFWSKVDRRGPDECWPWLSTRTPGGYGQFSINNRHHQAHRVSYELTHGPIPAGMHLDHLCRVRDCVNPNHTEIVTNRENVLRGNGPTAVNARKTLCVHGHPLDGRNRKTGRRFCLTCKSIWNAGWSDRYRARRALAERLATREGEK